MRRLGALGLAAILFASSAPAASGFTARHRIHDPTLAGGALYYSTTAARGAVVWRLDLSSGRSTIVYRAPRSSEIDSVLGGGGRVALKVSSRHGLGPESIVALDPNGGVPTTLATSPRVGGCGGSGVDLGHVSAEGDVLVDEVRTSCDPKEPGLRRLLAYGNGPVRELVRKRIGSAYGELDWRLVGGRLLRGSNRGIRVTELSTGASRTIVPRRRRAGFAIPELDPAGNVVALEVAHVGRRGHLFELRVHTPTDPPRGGRVLSTARRTPGFPVLCGAKLIEHRVSRREEALLIRDTLAAPRRMLRRLRTRGEVDIVCDERTLAVTDTVKRRTRIETYPLDGQ